MAAASFISRLRLTDFRSYETLSLDLASGPVVLCGENGAGKTNLIEAVSLLVPGQGLRRASFADIARHGGASGWSVFASLETKDGAHAIGTGWTPKTGEGERASGRSVKIDGAARSPLALGELLEVVWLTPAMDGLFTGPASDRRRFLDRMVAAFDDGHRTRLNRFDLAMRQRNRLLELPRAKPAELEGLEIVLAETGIAIAAARIEGVVRLKRRIEERRKRSPDTPFPWAEIALEGRIEELLTARPAVEAEDAYQKLLASSRDRDRAASRTLEGPHRSDLAVRHGQKGMPAALSSTGEQKGLLVGLVLAHAEAVAEERSTGAPIILLDEIAAHLDESRRAALFAEIIALGAQAFMTGTEPAPFAALSDRAQFLRVEAGRVDLTGQ